MAVLHLSVIVSIILSRTVLAALAIRPATNAMRVKGTGNFDVECKGDTYGRNLRLDSCTDALKQIPTSDHPLTFGLRGRMGVNVPTPWRWISSDGTCAIEVPETVGAQASYLDLVEAAQEMMDYCMDFTDVPEGSIASKIGGGLGRLALTMMSYKPEVRCRGPVILDERVVTNEILRKMPAPLTRTTFGRQGVPGVRVVLPRVYISVDRVLKTKLVATVDITPANLERASWYDIWAATVAISGMCVRNGKGGSSAYLGDGGKMSVTITEEPA